jgi:hypothetical protein
MARWWREKASYGGTSLKPLWSYYVSVCSFRFHFTTPDQIPKYIEFYQTKVLPSSRLPGFGDYPMRHHRFGDPRFGDHWECQRWYERLPLYLREESKRQRVVKALTEAYADFQKQDAKKRSSQFK